MKSQEDLQKFVGAAGSIRLFNRMNEALAENSEKPSPEAVSPDFDQPIIFENVSFRYEGNEPIFNGINIEIPPRQKVAFVGGVRGREVNSRDPADRHTTTRFRHSLPGRHALRHAGNG